MTRPFYFSSSLLTSIPFVSHGFFTRKGGVSTGDYASLNCKTASTALSGENDPQGQEVRDAPEHVAQNRRLIVQTLGGSTWVNLRQKHTAIVHVIDDDFLQKWTEEKATKSPDNLFIGDALITTLPSIVLSVITADCVPILLCDAQKPIIAAIHAGWEGAFNGVIENTVALMQDKGATEIVAAIGPCIKQDNYEVGPEFKDKFQHWQKAQPKAIFKVTFTDFFKETPHALDRFFFDLRGFVAHILKSSGVTHLDSAHQNTYAQPELFFSYRRSTHAQKPLGRTPIVGCQASSIMLQ